MLLLQLSKSPKIRELSLQRNGCLGADGVEAFTQALPENTVLERLSLGSCGLEGTAGGLALATLANMLGPELKSVCLRGNVELKTVGLMTFSEHLAENNELEEVDLGKCGLQESGGGWASAAVVHKTTKLELLQLNDNESLGPQGMAAFILNLPWDLPLKSIDVGNCGLSEPVDVRVVAGIFRRAPSLVRLNLNETRMLSNAGIAALVKAMPSNLDLSCLNVNSCGLEGAEGGRVVADLLARCSTA